MPSAAFQIARISSSARMRERARALTSTLPMPRTMGERKSSLRAECHDITPRRYASV